MTQATTIAPNCSPRRGRRIGGWLAAIVVATAGTSIALAGNSTISSAYAEPPTVTVSSYAGQDPYASGCSNGAYIANIANLSFGDGGPVVGTVENWYSPACRTDWAVEKWQGTGYTWVEIAAAAHEGDRVSNDFHQNYQSFGQGPQWTNMIDGTAVACIRAAFWTVDGWDACA